MLGFAGLAMLHGRRLSVLIRENIGLSIIIKRDVKENLITDFRQFLEKQPYTKSTEYIPREKAASDLQETLGEDFISFIGYNPLLPSIDVKLKADYTTNENMMDIEKQLLANSIVEEVIYQKSLVHLVNENINRISMVMVGFSILLLLISVALINNTIRLAVYSKRFLIRSMQLVGATQGFIRKPFIKQGILHGIYSAFLALILLALVIFFSRKEMPELAEIQGAGMFIILTCSVIVLGVLLSFISTYFAVGKYLRSSLDDLYQ